MKIWIISWIVTIIVLAGITGSCAYLYVKQMSSNVALVVFVTSASLVTVITLSGIGVHIYRLYTTTADDPSEDEETATAIDLPVVTLDTTHPRTDEEIAVVA